MSHIVFDGQTLECTDDGYLLDHKQWSRALARELASKDGLMLSDQQLTVCYLLRDFYRRTETAPTVRALVKLIGKEMGPEKRTSRYLHELFPKGPLRTASRYAGLPKPARCI